VHDDYLSASKCQEQCGGYAFAIVQYKDCYCSNFAPGDTTSTGDCNQECPGWPYEQCGSQGGSFGYIALDKQPEGTQGGSSSQAAAATSSTEAPVSLLAFLLTHDHSNVLGSSRSLLLEALSTLFDL
jgi:cell wall integrity and stress response component